MHKDKNALFTNFAFFSKNDKKEYLKEDEVERLKKAFDEYYKIYDITKLGQAGFTLEKILGELEKYKETKINL